MNESYDRDLALDLLKKMQDELAEYARENINHMALEQRTKLAELYGNVKKMIKKC